MVRYIDDHKHRFGVEPICRQLRIAPSTYYEQKLRQVDPSRLPARARRDIELRVQIHRVWHENFCAYGVRKTWKQLNREHIRVARCTVRRLMRDLGLRGVVRGKGFKTTIPEEGPPLPAPVRFSNWTPLARRVGKMCTIYSEGSGNWRSFCVLSLTKPIAHAPLPFTVGIPQTLVSLHG